MVGRLIFLLWLEVQTILPHSGKHWDDFRAPHHRQRAPLSIFACIFQYVTESNELKAAPLLSRAVISDNFANSSEHIMRNRVPPLQNSKNPHTKCAAKPPFLVPFFEFWRGGTRFLIIFSEEFAKLSLITARDTRRWLYMLEAVSDSGELRVILHVRPLKDVRDFPLHLSQKA